MLIKMICYAFAGFLAVLPSTSVMAEGKALKTFTLTAQQSAAMGLGFAGIEQVEGGGLVASASVTVPPGKQRVISAPYAGAVTLIRVGVGDKVKAGEGLAEFTSPQLGDVRRQWVEARSEQTLAEAALQRDQVLFSEDIIPAARLKTSQARAQTSRALVQARAAELKAAGVSFSDASAGESLYATGLLKASLSGVVLEAPVHLGERVEAGTMLFRIADPSGLMLDINTTAAKARTVRVGHSVQIPSRGAKGRVIGVSQTVDASQTAHIRVRVDVPGSLHMGEVVSAQVETRPQATSEGAVATPVWRLPARGVVQWRGQAVVFVQEGADVLMQGVTVLSSDDDQAVVEGSLAQGQRVAIQGVAALKALAQKGE